MITIVRTRDLAELRQRATRADREEVTDLVLRARKLALEGGSFLSCSLKDTDEVVRKTRPVAEWITSGYPDVRDLETRTLAATALLADLALDRPSVFYYPHDFINAAEQYYQLLIAPISDSRPAASLSTAQLRAGASSPRTEPGGSPR